MLIPRLTDPSVPFDPCVSIAQGAEWLRTDTGLSSGNDIQGLIFSAMESLETLCHQPLFLRTYYGYGTDFYNTQLQSVNVSSVTDVAYQVAGSMDWSAVSAPDFWFWETGELFFSDAMRLVLNVSRIRVTYAAGYATNTVPQDIVQAVRFLIGRWYDKRSDEKKDMPSLTETLMSAYKLPLI